MTTKKEIIVVLDNIRSTFNVGSIFRTADCVGVHKIYLVGITPAPIDRFGRERRDITKVSLGAEKNIVWEQVKDTASIIKKLKRSGFQIIYIEQAKNSIDYKKVKLDKVGRVAFVLGNEVTGIDPKLFKLADAIAEIPLAGKKESLNVLVAFAVAVFRILGK